VAGHTDSAAGDGKMVRRLRESRRHPWPEDLGIDPPRCGTGGRVSGCSIK